MEKKVLFLVLMLLSIVFCTKAYSQATPSDSCYMPLAIGNKWVFSGDIRAVNYASVHELKGLKIIEIKESKIVNGKEYFHFLNKWIRYDNEHLVAYSLKDDLGTESVFCAFNYANAQVYPGNPYQVGFTKITSILDTVVYLRGFIADSLGNHSSFLFSSRFGLSYMGYSSTNFAQASYYKEAYSLVGVYMADPNLGISKQINIAPTFSEPFFSANREGKLSIYIVVDHPYSDEDSVNYFEFPYKTSPSCFIDSVDMEYFYFNGVDTVERGKVNLKRSSAIRYAGNINYREDLVSDGYKLYYKFFAKDKNAIPHRTIYPNDGYLEMSIHKEDPYKLYPLAKSNVWVYFKSGNGVAKYITIEVKDDTLLSNGINYFKVLYDGVVNYERIDSATGLLIQAIKQTDGSIKENVLENLAVSASSDVYFNNFGIADSFICSRNNPTTFWGLTTPTKLFYLKGYSIGWYTRVEGLGLTMMKHYKKTDPNYVLQYKLSAARINGIVYGNHSLITSVEDKNINQPITFSLSQNYPNPFNPNTTIEYSIPESGMVELKVFDVLGREVKTLINGFVEVGNHSVNFNASNLSSGVYFYSIKYAGKNTITKKMLLTK